MQGGRRSNPVVDGNKVCTQCGRNLPVSYFHKYALSPSGLRSKCRDCVTINERDRRVRRQSGNVRDMRAKMLVVDGMKLCSVCGEMKPAECFSPAKHTAAKLETRCKQCNQLRRNAYKTRSVEAALGALCNASRHTNAKRGSKRRKAMAREIHPEYLIELWHTQHGCCAVTGIPMTHVYGQGAIMTNASIDRIDNRVGYTKANVRLVCYAVNIMRGQMTDDELYEWCRLIVERHEQVHFS